MPEYPTCPHKIPLPYTAKPRTLLEADQRDRGVPVFVLDSSECPGCLKERIRRADALIHAVESAPGGEHPFANPTIMQLWVNYVTDFYP